MGGDYLHSPDPLWLGLKARRRTPPRSGKTAPAGVSQLLLSQLLIERKDRTQGRDASPVGQPRERMDGRPGASGERRAEISLVLAGNSRRQGGRVSLGTLETQRVYNAWVASSKCIKSIRRPPATALLRRAHARARCRGRHLTTQQPTRKHYSTKVALFAAARRGAAARGAPPRCGGGGAATTAGAVPHRKARLPCLLERGAS